MIIGSIFRALGDLFTPALRQIFWRSIALTILTIGVAVGGVLSALDWALNASTFLTSYPWVEIYLIAFAGIGVFVAGFYMMPAVSMLVAGFFLDEVAAIIERRDYADSPAGRPMSTTSAMIESTKFFAVTLVANLLALFLLFVPGVNVLIFFVMNAYFFSREYFYLVAGRHHGRGTVIRLYRDHRGDILIAGIAIAMFVLIPLLNLLTPLFATVLMVHVVKGIEKRELI